MRGPGVSLDERLCAHEESGGTEAALDPMTVQKCFLQGMKAFFTAKAFNGYDDPTVQLGCRHEAGIDVFSVHYNGAGPHSPMPHPSLVPLRDNRSRIT